MQRIKAKFRKIHGEVSDLRTEGTGESFRAKQVVQDWYITEDSFLWVRGGRKSIDMQFSVVTVQITELLFSWCMENLPFVSFYPSW